MNWVRKLTHKRRVIPDVEVDEDGAVYLPADLPNSHVTVSYTAIEDKVVSASAYVEEPRGWWRWFRGVKA